MQEFFDIASNWAENRGVCVVFGRTITGTEDVECPHIGDWFAEVRLADSYGQFEAKMRYLPKTRKETRSAYEDRIWKALGKAVARARSSRIGVAA